MSATLTIDVNSQQTASQQPASSSAPDDFMSRFLAKQKDDTSVSPVSDFLAAKRRRFEDAQAEKREIEKERESKRAAAQQKRDEDWYDRQQTKLARDEQRRSEMAQRKAEAMQKRDEDWYDRDSLRAAKEKQSARDKALAQQKKDEDWYDRDRLNQSKEEERRKQQQWWNNPNNVAQWMNNRRVFQSGVRGSLMAQRLGFGAESGITKLAGSASMAAARLQPLIAVAGALVGAWSAARHNLMQEADRVRRYSPALRLQEMVNNARGMRTDQIIAAKYGDRMAELEDRQNRRDNAWRLIGAKVSGAIDGVFAPITDTIEEWYTSALEWLAESNKSSAKTNDYLKQLTGLTEKQLEEMGYKANTREAIAFAMRNAQKMMDVMEGGSSFPSADNVTEKVGKANLVGRGNAPNPGFVPVPNWWANQ